jgi:hypothetical protein
VVTSRFEQMSEEEPTAWIGAEEARLAADAGVEVYEAVVQ